MVEAEAFEAEPVESNLKLLRAGNIRKALDSVYASEDSSLDPALARLECEALGREDW